MIVNRTAVSATVKLLLASAVLATPAGAAEPSQQQDSLEEIYISALAIREKPSNVAAPFSIVDADELFRSAATTLGDALNALPGVHSDTFGGGVSRPVIRGQAPPRVSVLSDGATLFDASNVSPDHAVAAEPLLARRIEVLRGPSTLLYGSGAIGGVVNVLDQRIPDRLPSDSLTGEVGARGNTATRERSLAAGITARAGESFALRLEGHTRSTDDYSAPGGRVEGTFADSEGVTLGASFIGERGFLGASFTYRGDDYGLPGHAHEYEDCGVSGLRLDCPEYEEEEEEEEEAPPVIDLRSRRLDVRGELADPLAGFSRLRVRGSYTSYRHDEIEDGEIGTTFLNDAWEGRLEAEHRPVGPWTGVVGIQHSNSRAGGLGEEAFLARTRTMNTGVFLVEHAALSETLHVEAGARHEFAYVSPIGDGGRLPEFRGDATSVSGAVIWNFVPEHTASLSVSRSERLPFAQELYSRGVHLATNTYECGLLDEAATCAGGSADVSTETSRNIELAVRRTEGRLTWAVSAFRNSVGNFIYADTLDQVGDFRLVKYAQRDARFTGFEAELTWRFSDAVSATVFGDRVRGTLAAGGNLPRISPARYGARVNASVRGVTGELEFFSVRQQDDIAAFELATPGYDMLNLTIGWTPREGSPLRAFVRGNNLLDEAVFNHVSFLADVVPLPGRGISAGVQWSF